MSAPEQDPGAPPHYLTLQPRVVLLLSGTAALAVGPFALYQLLHGDLWLGLTVIVAVVLALVGTTLSARRRARLAAHLPRILAGGGNLTVALALLRHPEAGIYWVYPLLIFNFGSLGPRLGGAVNLLQMAGAALCGLPLLEGIAYSRYLVTLSLTCLFAFLFSTSMERQHRQLQRRACEDRLTGTGNRWAMEGALEAAVQRLSIAPQCLVLLDLDHFKQVNDSLGHERGDRVLADFCALLRRGLRPSDRLFRYGGEEFVVLLPDTPPGAGRKLAERLRRRVMETPLADGCALTVSAGVAELRSDDDVGSWLRRGDRCLYRAKELGRNRTVTPEDEPGLAT